MLKLARDENITTDAVGGICKALDRTADEYMEFYYECVRFMGHNL